MVDMARGAFPKDMAQAAHLGGAGGLEQAAEDVVGKVARYARENPVPALCWALGIGFVLGWRLKPW